MTVLRNAVAGDRRKARGFSLLEVLVAVVVLSVGLLALAALQGALTKSSSEAKVRGRVAAMLTARIDEMRSNGYGGLVPEGAAAPVTSTNGDCDLVGSPDATDWIDCAREQAALGSLTVDQTITTWYGNGTFATPAPVPANQNPRVAQFKRVQLVATWQDAAGIDHSLELRSDVSSMSLTNFVVVPPDPTGNPMGGPIVRTIDPATDGVIPIALGTESTSATTNPSPELVGQGQNQQIVGTRFSVLNYTPATAGTDGFIVQKRFDNEVIKCQCRYGAGGDNLPEIYRTAQWPTIWTGDRYEVHVPDGNPAAPGQTLESGPRPGVEQSALCQECCRDHHDTGTSGEVRFDPLRTDGVAKYDITNQGVLDPNPVNNMQNGTYVDSCRLIRVDGFWRTASDLYARQFGMLQTEAQGDQAAKSGLPTTSAVAQYTSYVRSQLAVYNGTNQITGDTAQTNFNSGGAFDAPTITIPTASNTDYRYLHVRSLYVDHLEAEALQKISDVLADGSEQGPCPEDGDDTNDVDCVMAYLPFTTANLTEIAKWQESTSGVINVNDANLLATNPAQPSGGRTHGLGTGNADSNATVRLSNTGLAVNDVMPDLEGVDPADQSTTYADAQPFQVGTPPGPTFDVQVSGGGANPFVFFTLGTDANVECLKPAGTTHRCTTTANTSMPQSGTIRVSNYWMEDTTQRSVTATCGTTVATATIAVPTFHNYELTTATNNGLGGTIGASTDDNSVFEATDVIFASIAAGSLSTLTFTEQGTSPTYATVLSCTTNGGANQIKNIVWDKPWQVDPTP